MSVTGFHPLWDKILSQILQAFADQGCHLEGSSPYKGIAFKGVYCNCEAPGNHEKEINVLWGD
jgi:hypothetical protein